MVIGELNLATIVETRSSGTVLPLLDAQRRRHPIPSPRSVIL
jgi:hypothetical protein